VLRGLGFLEEDFGRDCGALSGGWQMRVALATLLLRRPDVLLLDEPTNYLDLEARTWLEEFLVCPVPRSALNKNKNDDAVPREDGVAGTEYAATSAARC
jgi:ATP-binding cassette subfamily F protein 3